MDSQILPETRVSVLSADPTGELQPTEIDSITLLGTLSVAQAMAEVEALGYSVMTDSDGGCSEVDYELHDTRVIVVSTWPQQEAANDTPTLEAVTELVKGGKFFSVTFTKKTDGTLRRMLCRTGVRRYLKGGKAYDFQERGLLPVWDVRNRDYRCVPICNIKRLTAAGRTYQFS